MAAAIRNYVWDQGEDLEINMIYKQGEAGAVAPVDLTGYQLRMDIRKNDVEGVWVWTLNSDDIVEDPSVDAPGETDNEVTLGVDGAIIVQVPRSLTLPGGAIHAQLSTGATAFAYDIFLRNPQNKQRKILTGLITVTRSVTLWS